MRECNPAPQNTCWKTQFPGAATSATVQYVLHGKSTVTCVLIDKEYTGKLILGSVRAWAPESPPPLRSCFVLVD